MADLLIRDVAMPKDKNTTLIIYCDGTINLRVQMEDGEHLIPITAKAVSHPEGHGDLVDVKELLNDKEGLQIFKGDFRLAFDRIIERANTVVPAEGGNDDDSKL